MTTTPKYKDIFCAVRQNDLPAVKHMIEEKGDLATILDPDEKTVAIVAAECGSIPILEYILNKNSTLLSIHDKFGNTVLERAIDRGDLKMVKYLVEEHGVDIQKPEHRIHTAVHVAAQLGQLEILKYFIEDKNADVNLSNEIGETPMFSAAEKPYLYIVVYLLETCKADPMITDLYNENILFKSAIHGDILVPKYLLDVKRLPFDINWRNTRGYTAVNIASKFDKVDFVKWVVGYKRADLSIPDTLKGRTPLHHAAAGNFHALCKYLVEHNADPDVKDVFGFTPIQLTNDEKTISVIFQHKARTRIRRDLFSGFRSANAAVLKMEPKSVAANSYANVGFLETSKSDSIRDANNRLDSFLMIADTLIRYTKGSSQKSIKSEISPSPQELLKQKIDPVAVNSVHNLIGLNES